MELATTDKLTLPLYVHDVNLKDNEYHFLGGDGVEYITEGYIVVELEHKLVGSYHLRSECYPYTSYSTPIKAKYYSDYENSEDDAMYAAQCIQQDMVNRTGVIFPIYVKILDLSSLIIYYKLVL